MKRSTPLARAAPLARRSSSSSSLKSAGFKKKRGRAKRPAGYADAKMRNACAGQPCYLRYPGVCCGDHLTVVPAHSNEGAHGKGGALKARDRFTLPACHTCHYEHDQGKRFDYEYKCARWRAAYREWTPARARLLGHELEAEDAEFTEIL
jgi:hypothetical protein